MQYNTDYTNQLYSFTNNISTYEGGTHEDGVKRALTRIINNYAKNAKILKDKDIEELSKIENVEKIYGSYEVDGKIQTENSEIIKEENVLL